jgi:hypothetical protein
MGDDSIAESFNSRKASMKFAATAVGVVGLAICATACTPNIMLKNPQTGETTVCKGGNSYGLMGIPGRNLQERCLDDFEKAGYQRIASAK